MNKMNRNKEDNADNNHHNPHNHNHNNDDSNSDNDNDNDKNKKYTANTEVALCLANSLEVSCRVQRMPLTSRQLQNAPSLSWSVVALVQGVYVQARVHCVSNSSSSSKFNLQTNTRIYRAMRGVALHPLLFPNVLGLH